MKKGFWIIILIGFFACEGSQLDDRSSTQSSNKMEPDGEDYQLIKFEESSFLIDHLCDSIRFEMTDLHHPVKEIPDNDSLLLVDELEKIGFEKIMSGRGNWESGPRIVSITLQKKKCRCQIDKLYYSKNKESKTYFVSERISCKNSGKK